MKPDPWNPGPVAEVDTGVVEVEVDGADSEAVVTEVATVADTVTTTPADGIGNNHISCITTKKTEPRGSVFGRIEWIADLPHQSNNYSLTVV